MYTYLNLLKTQNIFRNITIIQLVCYFGNWFSHVAVYTLLIQLGAPDWAITMAASFPFLGAFFIAPVSGTLIDKFSTKPFMITMLAIELISVSFLLWIDSLEWLWLILSLVIIRMAIGSIYFQTQMALFPHILKRTDLKAANEIHSIVWSISFALGMSLAGIYIDRYGIKSAILLDMLLYASGIFILFKTPIISIASKVSTKIVKMMKEGFEYIRKKPLIIHLILLHSCIGFTTYDLIIAFLAKSSIYMVNEKILSASLTIGLLNSARALALLVGPIALTSRVNNKTLFWLFLAQGLGISFWGFLQENFFISLVGMFVAGFCTTVLWSFTFTLLQKATDKEYYGRVIAYNDMAFMASSTSVSLVIGWLYENTHLGISWITVLLGLVFCSFAYYWKWVQKNYNVDVD